MGYSTTYTGKLTITPPLTKDHRKYLGILIGDKYRENHVKDVFAPALPEDVRTLLVKVCEAGGDVPIKVFEMSSLDGDDEYTRCSVDEAVPLLQMIIGEFLIPNGYQVEGELDWDGDQGDDNGIIYVKDGKVEAVLNNNDNPGPSWDRKPEPDLKQIAFYIADARRVLSQGAGESERETAMVALDHAAGLIPDECWPTHAELNKTE